MQLTKEQQTALEIIDKKQFILLHGVTGSGKTEVYLQQTEKTLRNGKQVIVLVPEISLTPQTIKRFAERFPIAVIHSKLTPKQRKLEWQKIINNEVSIVVGARSAIFAPFDNLGLIIVDEEHDSSYKQDNNPRYHSVAVALKRAEITGAKVILGTATPSLETYYQFKDHPDKNYGYIEMTYRVNNLAMPAVEIIDMRKELAEKNFSVLSKKLRDLIKNRMDRKEKTMLFLNRRGFSTFVSCRSCGHVLECDRCNVSLTYHQDHTAHCHYCDKVVPVPETCPKCGSKYFKYFGSGTQKLEAELEKFFGNIKILRMDKDTTKKRGSHKDILDEFVHGEADVLIGTQMIAKGHDFHNVTLVGIVSADLSLYIPDFRAAERTFQLLSQVAGRTGRGVMGGNVIIQTYSPEHFAIEAAAKHNYLEFYNMEIKNRRELNYPPFSKLTLITVSAPQEAKVISKIKELAAKYPQEKVLGPVPSPIKKIRGFYRWQFLLKNQEINYLDFPEKSDVKIDIDVDPINMY